MAATVGDNRVNFTPRRRPRTRFVVKRVKLTMSPTTVGAVSSVQLRLGYAGIIKGISLDFSAGANASGVVVIKEKNSAGPTLFTSTTATDTTGASTGQLLVPATDGLGVTNAGTGMTDHVHQFYAHGLYLSYASATAGDTVIVRLLIDTGVFYHRLKPVHTGTLTDGNVAGTDAFYLGRPGILRAIRVSASAGSTADLTIKVDKDDQAAQPAGATVFTATNFGTSAIVGPATAGTAACLDSPGLDEVNGAVTTPSGGGIPFLHGFTVSLAQCNVADAIVVEAWIEV